jgi:hypothetical protein
MVYMELKFKSDDTDKNIKIDVPNELVDDGENMIRCYEQKLTNRFIVRIDGIPAYMVKETGIPSFYYSWGFKRYNRLTMILYNPINPSGTKAVLDTFSKTKKCNIRIEILGPVGDIVESWDVSAKLQSVNFTQYNWTVSEVSEIFLTFNIKRATLN